MTRRISRRCSGRPRYRSDRRSASAKPRETTQRDAPDQQRICSASMLGDDSGDIRPVDIGRQRIEPACRHVDHAIDGDVLRDDELTHDRYHDESSAAGFGELQLGGDGRTQRRRRHDCRTRARANHTGGQAPLARGVCAPQHTSGRPTRTAPTADPAQRGNGTRRHLTGTCVLIRCASSVVSLRVVVAGRIRQSHRRTRRGARRTPPAGPSGRMTQLVSR